MFDHLLPVLTLYLRVLFCHCTLLCLSWCWCVIRSTFWSRPSKASIRLSIYIRPSVHKTF